MIFYGLQLKILLVFLRKSVRFFDVQLQTPVPDDGSTLEDSSENAMTSINTFLNDQLGDDPDEE